MNNTIMPGPHAAPEPLSKEIEAGQQAVYGTGSAIRVIGFDNAVKFTDAVVPKTSIRTGNLA